MKRKLSAMERAMWLGGQTVPINFAITARISGTFSTDQLHAALARVRELHPLAAVRVVVDKVEGPCFVSEGVPAFPVRVVTGCGDADWTTAVGEELGEPFPLDTGPLVRFVLLRGADFSDLVTVCHHGICDGIAGAYLLRDILRLLGEPDALLTPPPAPPDLWTLIPSSVKANPRVKLQMLAVAAWLRVTRAVQRLTPKTAPMAPTAGDLPAWKRFCVLGWALSEAQTSALITRCQVEGTSVHAAICAAWLRAFAEMGAGQKSWVRRASSPTNLRNRLTPPASEAFGLFMSNVVTAVNCAPGRDFWDIARDIKRELNEGSKDEKVFLWSLALQSMVSVLSDADMRSALAEFARQPISYDFSMTNLGRLDFPVQYGPLRVEAIYGPAVNTCEQERTVGITTIGGRMFFTFAFRDFVLDPAAAEQLKAQAMARLGEAAGW